MGHLTQPYYEKGEARGYEKGEAKGRQEGLVKGLQQGRIEGHVEVLIRLLEKRFGALPSHLQERISAADGTAIENWFDRAIEAPDLRSVFEKSH